MSTTVQARRSLQWSRLLTWHLAVVIVASLAAAALGALPIEFVLTPAGALVAALVGLPAAVLGLPWSALLPLAHADLGPLDRLWSAALFLPPFVDVALHQRLLVWLRSRPARDPAPATSTGRDVVQPVAAGPVGSGDSALAARVVAFGACALVGAALWGAWLGWDTTLFTTADQPEPHGPHTTAQVVACALSVGVVTAALARWRNPVVVAGGITFGFWVPWSAQAAAGPLSGSLWAVGSALLLFGLVAGTGITAVLGYASRRWRTPTPAWPAPGLPGQWWRTGTALVVVAGCWLLIGAVVRQVLPLAWTYLVVLHVPLDLVAAAAMVSGAVLVVVSIRRRRAAGQRLRPLAPAAALAAALVLAVLIGRALPAGNGFDGQVGVMAGPDGQPVAVIGLCQGSADTLVVLDLESDLADRSWEERGEEAQAASLRHDGALEGVTTVDLGEPSPSWSGSALGDPARGEGDLNITATGRGSLLDDTYFTRAQIERLPPGMVTFSVWQHPDGPRVGNEQVPLADFADVACSGRGRNG